MVHVYGKLFLSLPIIVFSHRKSVQLLFFMSKFWSQVSLSEEHSMINFALTEKLGKKNSEFQMGFEPTTLRDLVGCSTTELLETLW